MLYFLKNQIYKMPPDEVSGNNGLLFPAAEQFKCILEQINKYNLEDLDNESNIFYQDDNPFNKEDSPFLELDLILKKNMKEGDGSSRSILINHIADIREIDELFANAISKIKDLKNIFDDYEHPDDTSAPTPSKKVHSDFDVSQFIVNLELFFKLVTKQIIEEKQSKAGAAGQDLSARLADVANPGAFNKKLSNAPAPDKREPELLQKLEEDVGSTKERINFDPRPGSGKAGSGFGDDSLEIAAAELYAQLQAHDRIGQSPPGANLGQSESVDDGSSSEEENDTNTPNINYSVRSSPVKQTNNPGAGRSEEGEIVFERNLTFSTGHDSFALRTDHPQSGAGDREPAGQHAKSLRLGLVQGLDDPVNSLFATGSQVSTAALQAAAGVPGDPEDYVGPEGVSDPSKLSATGPADEKLAAGVGPEESGFPLQPGVPYPDVPEIPEVTLDDILAKLPQTKRKAKLSTKSEDDEQEYNEKSKEKKPKIIEFFHSCLRGLASICHKKEPKEGEEKKPDFLSRGRAKVEDLVSKAITWVNNKSINVYNNSLGGALLRKSEIGVNAGAKFEGDQSLGTHQEKVFKMGKMIGGLMVKHKLDQDLVKAVLNFSAFANGFGNIFFKKDEDGMVNFDNNSFKSYCTPEGDGYRQVIANIGGQNSPASIHFASSVAAIVAIIHGPNPIDRLHDAADFSYELQQNLGQVGLKSARFEGTAMRGKRVLDLLGSDPNAFIEAFTVDQSSLDSESSDEYRVAKEIADQVAKEIFETKNPKKSPQASVIEGGVPRSRFGSAASDVVPMGKVVENPSASAANKSGALGIAA